MEGLNQKILSFPARIFARIFSGLGLMVFLSGCYQGSSNPIPPIYGFGCQNCTALLPAPVPLTTFQSQGTDGSVVLTNMQLYGQVSSIQTNASGANYKWYSGAIAMQGTMTVNKTQFDYDSQTGQRASACAVPPGVYTLQTRLAGQMDTGGINIMMPSLVTTDGTIEIKIEAASPMGLLEEGRRLWANVSIVRVNGILCSQHFFGEFN